MKYLKRLAIPCLLIGLSMSVISAVIPRANSAIAQDLQDLTGASSPTKFIQFPSLISVDTSDRETNTRNAIYSFQISIPVQAGATLQKVTIAQQDPIESITFASDRTTAYIQEPSGDRIAVATKTMIDPNTKAASIVFTSPVAAGKIVVVSLRPVSNPSLEGEYVFGVTAFADSLQGQFIGNGRLGIYNSYISDVFVPTF